MAQDVRKRFQKTVTYVTNGQKSEDLSRGLTLRSLFLRLTGAPTVTAGNNTLANTALGAEWGCVKLIELIANGNQVIRSMTGRQLFWYNYFMYGVVPPLTPGIGDGATANAPFDVVLALPMWMPRSIRPMDTALDTSLLSDFKIRITWGTYTDINSAATAWTTSPQIDVHSLESSGAAGPFALQTVYATQNTITASDPKKQIYLPTGDMYRGFLINTTDAGVDVNDILNNVKFKSGTTVFYDQPDVMIKQAEGWLSAGIPHQIQDSIAAGVYQSGMRGTPNDLAGWYFIDFVTDGRLTESIDTRGFSEAYLELDVTVGAGTTVLNILPIQVRPVRNAQQA